MNQTGNNRKPCDQSPTSSFTWKLKKGFDVNVVGMQQSIVCNMRLVGSWFHLCVWILHDETSVAVVFLFHSCVAFVEHFEVL